MQTIELEYPTGHGSKLEVGSLIVEISALKSGIYTHKWSTESFSYYSTFFLLIITFVHMLVCMYFAAMTAVCLHTSLEIF